MGPFIGSLLLFPDILYECIIEEPVFQSEPARRSLFYKVFTKGTLVFLRCFAKLNDYMAPGRSGGQIRAVRRAGFLTGQACRFCKNGRAPGGRAV